MLFLWIIIAIITCGVIMLIVYTLREIKSEKNTPITLIYHKIDYGQVKQKYHNGEKRA
jgi:hypothetical protein